MTIPLTIISFVIGLVIALAVALARLSSNVVLSNVARFYISIIRGTPLLVQLFIVFFALPEFGVKIDPFPAAVIAFSLNVGGYAAEIIRSAIQSIPKGQWEAAETIGLNYAGALRRIILPQAARVAVPPLSNTLISLVKDTSLASTILVTELLRQAQIVAAPTFEFFALYGTAAVYYWVICLVLSFGQAAWNADWKGTWRDDRTHVTAEPRSSTASPPRASRRRSATTRCSRASRSPWSAARRPTIIGPSGSGKTTLLRTLNALDRADAGVIRVDDVEIDFSTPDAEGRGAQASSRAAASCSRGTTCSRTRRCCRTSSRVR